MIDVDKEGAPVNSCMVQTKDLSLICQPGRTKDHPVYRQEAKPWGEPPYPHRSRHASVELHYLYRTALQLGGNVANLGTYRGSTASAMAHGIKDAGGGKVYTVDLHDENGAYSIEQLRPVFEGRGLGDYVEFCKGYTHQWAKRLGDKSFNLLFIDADHHYESCLQDFKLWSPLVSPAGIVAFHDVDINTVDRVIREELKDWEQIDHVFKIKSFRRMK
jgi:predicted O-methyltransferase YrrM